MRRLLKILKYSFYSLVSIVLLLLILIQFAGVQRKVAEVVKNKILAGSTLSDIQFERIKIGLTGKLSLYKLSVPGDYSGQLVEIEKLKAKVSVAALLKKKISLRSVLLKGTKGQIYRYKNNSFNFSGLFPEKSTPDSTKIKSNNNLDFEVGKVELEDIQFRYHDSLTQVFLDVDLGYFITNLNGSDIVNFGFQFDKIVLEETHVVLGLDKRLIPRKRKNNKVNPILPNINAEALKVDDISFLLNDLSKNSYLQAKVDKMSSKGILVDIENELVDVKSMELKNSNYTMDYRADTVAKGKLTEKLVEKDESINFSGGWTINAYEVKGKDVSVLMQLNELKDSLQIFHGTNFGFENIDFTIAETTVQKDQIKSNIKSISCTDANNFQLLDAAIDFTMSEKLGLFNVHNFRTQHSSITAKIDVDFPLTTPNLKQLVVRRVLMKGSLSPNELAYFIPTLPGIEVFDEKEELNINVDVKGNEKDILLQALELNTPGFFSVKGRGNISNYNNINSLSYNFWIDSLEIESLYETQIIQSTQLSPDLPPISSKIKVSGVSDSLLANMVFIDNSGSVKAEVLAINDSINWELSSLVEIHEINLANYLNDTLLSNLSGELDIRLMTSGYDSIKSLSIDGELFSFGAGSTNIENLVFDGKYENEYLFFHTKHDSKELDFLAEVNGILNTDSLNLEYKIQIDTLNTKDFRLTRDDLNISTSIKGDFNYHNQENLTFSSNFHNLNLNYLDENLRLDQLYFKYQVLQNYELTEIKTDGVKIRSEKNISVDAVKQKTLDFLKNTVNPEASYVPQEGDKLTVTCNMRNPGLIQSFIGRTILDTLIIESFDFDYDLHGNIFSLDINIPHIGYKGIFLEDIKTRVLIEDNTFNTKAFLNKVQFGSIKSNHFELNAYSNAEGINTNLKLFDKKDELAANIPVIMSQVDSILRFRLNPDSVLISQNLWQTNNKVAIQYDFKNKEWSSDGVEVQYGDQAIEFTETAREVSMKLKNLNLENISSFFTISDTNFITKGQFSANMSLSNQIPVKPLISAEARIEDIHLLNIPYGNLQFGFHQISDNNFKTDFSLRNQFDYVNYEGNFGEKSSHQHIGEVNIVDLSAYTVIIDTHIINLKEGGIKSNLHATTRKNDFKLGGYIQANDALIHLPQIGAQFKIVDEKFSFDEKGAHFSKINIEDLAGNKLNVHGNIFTTNYRDFIFDLSINSEHFQLLNSTIDQNENFYGQLVISADVDLKGTVNAPILKANIKVHERTDITVVLPGDDPLQSGAEDVVRFAEVTNVDADSIYITNSLTSVSDSIESIIRQGDLNLVLSFNPLARYKVITNPISGDYAYFGLNGALAYRTVQNGLTELTGNIQIIDGLYEMSFYEMIKKEFTIEPQSTIYFSGPVSNTTLDLKAKNIVRTNSLALMSSESIGNSAEEKALYNQRLPYELYFIVGGLLLSPEVSFALDLPDEYKQNSPMIASKLNKLSSPEMEQERNMQVFALLVTGGFIAENTGVTSGSGSSDVAAATARNSVNSILSQQLNRLTSDNIKYFDMNLGLNTYEDYARRGGNTTTDLDVQISKSLFDDKVNFEMESRINLDGSSTTNQSSSNYNTDYKLYYNLNEKGTYKAKAYNLSIYDLFDGDITNTGIGIVFSKDFEGKKRRNYVEIDSTPENE